MNENFIHVYIMHTFIANELQNIITATEKKMFSSSELL